MSAKVLVRNTEPADFAGIRDIAQQVYPGIEPWSTEQLSSHLEVFPEGQFVAVDRDRGTVLGMCSGLILNWDDYDLDMDWQAFTDRGRYTNHDPANGRTLYAADVMVRPGVEGRGVGKKLYAAGRFDLARRLKLRRVRAGARLRGYGRHADRLSPEEYVVQVVRGQRRDPTLSFQLRQGFRVLGVTSGFFDGDPESRGHAALIEWLNPEEAPASDHEAGDPRYRPEPGGGPDGR